MLYEWFNIPSESCAGRCDVLFVRITRPWRFDVYVQSGFAEKVNGVLSAHSGGSGSVVKFKLWPHVVWVRKLHLIIQKLADTEAGSLLLLQKVVRAHHDDKTHLHTIIPTLYEPGHHGW